MKIFNVTIEARIVQVIQVEAESRKRAEELAYEEFDVDELANEVSFSKDVLTSEEVK